MASTDIVPVDVNDRPELLSDGRLMDVAGIIIKEYNLDISSILALADTLDQLEAKDDQDQLEIKDHEDEPVTEDLEHEPEVKKMKALKSKALENESVFENHEGEPKIDDPEGMIIKWEMMYPAIKDNPKIKKNKPPVSFLKMCEIMCDLDNELPDWLTSSTNRVQDYTDKHFYIISVMAEVRYWIGEAKHSHEQLKIWQIVFSLPRNVHAQMINKSDATIMSKWLNIEMDPCSFAAGIPEYFFEDMSESYKQLRETHFPNGIDDALPVYFKHMEEGEVAVAQLRRRVSWLAKMNPDVKDTTLYKETSKVLCEMTKTLLKNYHMSEKWNNFTKSQKLYYQLPGVDLGLPYGENVHVEFDTNKPWVMVYPEGEEQPFWTEVGNQLVPVRWQVGSPWLDFLRNMRQDHPALRTFDKRDLLCPPVLYTKKNPGPMEMRMPPVLLKMTKHYIGLNYECHQVDTYPPGPSEKKAKAVEKRLAKGTGENWLIPGRWDEGYTSTTLEIQFPAKAVLDGRPRHDAFGNLRCDYMGAILRELRIGKWTFHYKKDLQVAIRTGGGCDEDTPLGYDLTWPEPPKHLALVGVGQGQDQIQAPQDSGEGSESEDGGDETEVEDGDIEDGDIEDGDIEDGDIEDGDIEDGDVMDTDE